MGNVIARIAAATLCIALLASCGSGSDPALSTTPATTPAPVPQTTSPPASPTPTETPTVETVRPEIDIPEPEKYEQMANDDLEGADHAARYYLDLYGYIYETGDFGPWNSLSDPGCAVCDVIEERVSAYYAQGQWFENFALLHGDSIVYYPTEEDPYYLVEIEVLAPEYLHYDSTGELIVKGVEALYPEYTIGVVYEAPNEWKVVDIHPGDAAE